MSEWIESHANLPRHPKIKRLARSLGVPVLPHAVGYVHALWYYVLDFAPGGSLSGHDPADIAEACGWEADAGAFIAAFVEARLIDPDLRLHDWEDYNSSHRSRMAAAERQRQKRTKDRSSNEVQPISNEVQRTSNELQTQPVDNSENTCSSRQNVGVSRDVTVTVTPVTLDRQTDRQTDRTDTSCSRARVKVPVDNSDFEAFWGLYPRKQGKAKAAEEYARAAKQAKPETIIAGLRRQLPWFARQLRQDGDFRPMPATWLHQGRWEDEPEGTAVRKRDEYKPPPEPVLSEGEREESLAIIRRARGGSFESVGDLVAIKGGTGRSGSLARRPSGQMAPSPYVSPSTGQRYSGRMALALTSIRA